ncbi:GNAT family N-acetyltransferase [Rheinheimera sp.]|uniref:GNAT family N-acetyltransferase n=1 Tax=Rheinheimera sp. TaxID=1869214 RepID=UPI0027B8A0FC|nr:GNAT family N-acetyltransferase [Rheinheimera sp.]
MADFVLQPLLTGTQISLLPLQADDFEALYLAASDPLIWQLHPEPNRYQREVFQRFFDSGIASGSAFKVIDNQSGLVIGSSRYYDINLPERELAIGYSFLARSHWGGVVNGEMKQLMLQHAFLHVDKVWLHIGADNIRSRRAVEKIGGVFSHQVEDINAAGETEYKVHYYLTPALYQAAVSAAAT